jgi:hypothetical protein
MNKLRTILLLVLIISMGATGIELLLLEHIESRWQWLPIVLLGLGIGVSLLLAIWPTRPAFALFRVVMAACTLSGLIGIWLHYRGNVEFELEMNTALHGFELFRDAMMGATPALAPGSMTQLGLLGLIYTYRHPRLQDANARRHE